jgi:hypothetical protein
MESGKFNYELFFAKKWRSAALRAVTHPQPPLKRGACAIALWGEGF